MLKLCLFVFFTRPEHDEYEIQAFVYESAFFVLGWCGLKGILFSRGLPLFSLGGRLWFHSVFIITGFKKKRCVGVGVCVDLFKM